MGEILSFDITLPTSWNDLTDRQLRLVFALFARDLSAAEVKAMCLMKWNKLTILNEFPKHTYLLKKGKQKANLTSRQIQAATATLDFLDTIPTTPIRITQLGRHHALPANFEGVPFETFLYVDNLYQGVIHTANKENTPTLLNIQSSELLIEMTQILYNTDKKRIEEPFLIGSFYWWASLKQYFAALFPHFFTPIDSAPDANLLGSSDSLFHQLRDASNAQIRALTGGDITKESTILKMDTHRALTELDAKAHEAEEYRKSIPQ